MRTVSQVLQRRTFQPVRRHSRLAGREAAFWRPFDRNDVPRLLLAAERFERETRRKGQRSGELGSVALEVLRAMTRLVDFRTGRLEPALATLCSWIKRSKDAVVRALARLRAAGFLDWIRRYVETGNEGRGVQVQQTSNAYRLALPPRAMRLLGRAAAPPPIPDDEAARHAGDARQLQAMIEQLPLWEQPAQMTEDRELADALARLGRAVAERESVQRSESGL